MVSNLFYETMAEETKAGIDAATPALQQDSGPAMETETASNHRKSQAITSNYPTTATSKTST